MATAFIISNFYQKAVAFHKKRKFFLIFQSRCCRTRPCCHFKWHGPDRRSRVYNVAKWGIHNDQRRRLVWPDGQWWWSCNASVWKEPLSPTQVRDCSKCFSTLTCKVLLNQLQHKIGQHDKMVSLCWPGATLEVRIYMNDLSHFWIV